MVDNDRIAVAPSTFMYDWFFSLNFSLRDETSFNTEFSLCYYPLAPLQVHQPHRELIDRRAWRNISQGDELPPRSLSYVPQFILDPHETKFYLFFFILPKFDSFELL